MMDSINNKNPSGSTLSLPPTTALTPSYASMEIHIPDRTFPFKGHHHLLASLPELRFRTQDAHNDVIVDPIKSCSASSIGDDGLEVDDDLFSTYIDLEKLEEQEGNAGHDDDVHVNGGGFVVGSGDDVGKRRRKRKKADKNVKNQTRKTQRCNEQKTCPVYDGGFWEPKNAILAEELAKLSDINPKRAQRYWNSYEDTAWHDSKCKLQILSISIMSNRQSAARSKEKKARYTLDLEKNVKTLHAKTTELTSQLAINQKEITDLAAESSELKLQLQTMERQVKLYDDQNEELQLEIERLKTAIGEMDYSDWLNMRMNHMPHGLSNSHVALPQLPTSPMSQHELLPQLHSSQLRMSPQYLHSASSHPLTQVLQKNPIGASAGTNRSNGTYLKEKGCNYPTAMTTGESSTNSYQRTD